jgi:FkbM family methyltransferase
MNEFKRTFGFINSHPLATKHLFKAYFKFIIWQFRTRFSRNIQIVKWIGNLKVLAKKGLTGITGNLYTGLHEFDEMGFLLHFLNENDIFFDVGANVGSYTLLAAGIKKAICISFEPAPETFKLLEANVKLNKLGTHVTCVRAAVGADAGYISFTQDQDTTNHVITGHGLYPNDISVPVVKLDAYCFHRPILLKIDVEGFETEVLKGSQDLLKQQDLTAIIIELNGSGGRYQYSEEDVHQQLLESGFEPYAYNPFSRYFTALNYFGGFNTIYIRDIEAVKTRVKKAPSFSIFGEHI